MKVRILLAIIFFLIGVNKASAQTTAFTYQGKLSDGASPANGSHEFEFKLFDALTGGVQIGSTLTLEEIIVTNGIFTVQLDFGAAALNGASRFLEISVRPSDGPGGGLLTPRQPVTSAPYSIRSLNSTSADTLSGSCIGCVSDANINSISGGKVSGLIPVGGVPAGSQNYIHNSGVVQGGDFNIDGDGVAEVFSARSQFNIGNNRVLSIAGIANTFAGLNAGTASTGNSNSFFGNGAGGGPANSGNSNSFFGERAGASNTTGAGNSFFGSAAGVSNTSGQANSFFGLGTGQLNTTGVDNAFFGAQAGFSNTAGSGNSFFGRGAGVANTGSNNSSFGAFAGGANTTGTFNSFFGYRSGNSNTTGISNTFFGWDAGRANVDGCCNTFMGVQAGQFNTSGTRNVFIGHETGQQNTTGSNNTLIGFSADLGANNLTFATAIGAQANVSTSNTIALGRTAGSDRVLVYGGLSLLNLPPGGVTPLCVDGGVVSRCSSSLRYKIDVNTFFGGLDVVHRLRPITFNWKESGTRDLGFAAEEVEQIEPLLATYHNGQIQGVKYAQITTVLVNAVNEQQTQIEALRKELEGRKVREKSQQSDIDVLKQLVCSIKPGEKICQQ